MAKTVYQVLEEKFREMQQRYEQGVYDGDPKDYAEYKRQVGVITGLALARRELADLAKQQRKAEDDE